MNNRIAFFVFDESIHAKRRIKLLNENQYLVYVISNFDYSDYCHKSLVLRKYENESKIKVLRYIYKIIMDYINIRAFLKMHEIKLISLQTLIYPSYLALLLPKKFKKILTFWNGDVIWWAKWDFIEKLFKKYIFQLGLNNVDAITVNSLLAYNICSNYMNDISKIHLIRYPGCDTSIFKHHNEIKINDNEIKIFNPRGFYEYVDHDLLLLFLKNLSEKTTKRIVIDHLNLFSSVKHRDFILSKYKNYRVNLIEKVEWNKMPLTYSQYSIITSISDYESMPNTVIESMSSSSIVLAKDISQLREIIIDNENGYLINSLNIEIVVQKIIDILNDISLADLMRKKARNTIVECFSVKSEVPKYINLISKYHEK